MVEGVREGLLPLITRTSGCWRRGHHHERRRADQRDLLLWGSV